MARRWWTFTPRRCAVCRNWLSRSRWQLGLSVCSGACNRRRYEQAQACGVRDHLWQITGGEGWRCLYCSRITDDVALVRVTLTEQKPTYQQDDATAVSTGYGQVTESDR